MPATVNLLSLNSMSSTEASIRWAAIFLPLAMILSIALTIARAADGEAAAAVGAHAERDFRGVAVHDVHLVDRHAELRGDELREGRFVPLAVAVRAGEDRDAAGRMHADVGAPRTDPARAPSEPTTAEGAMPQASM